MAFFLRQKRKGSNPVKGAPCRSGWRVGLLHIHILDFPRGRFGRGGVLVGKADARLALHVGRYVHRYIYPAPSAGAPSRDFHFRPVSRVGCAAGVVAAKPQCQGGFVYVDATLRADGVLERQGHVFIAGEVEGRRYEPAFGVVCGPTDERTGFHVFIFIVVAPHIADAVQRYVFDSEVALACGERFIENAFAWFGRRYRAAFTAHFHIPHFPRGRFGGGGIFVWCSRRGFPRLSR